MVKNSTSPNNTSPIKIYRPKNEVEANLILALLKENNIEALLLRDWPECTHATFTIDWGPGGIEVNSEDAEMAKAVISDYLSSIKENRDFAGDEEQPLSDS